jgi:hypothetical protein
MKPTTNVSPLVARQKAHHSPRRTPSPSRCSLRVFRATGAKSPAPATTCAARSGPTEGESSRVPAGDGRNVTNPHGAPCHSPFQLLAPSRPGQARPPRAARVALSSLAAGWRRALPCDSVSDRSPRACSSPAERRIARIASKHKGVAPPVASVGGY